MSFRRVGGLAAVVLATVMFVACGQVYRPVVIPISTAPPNTANFHAVYAISTNSPFYPGTATQIDVSGDTMIGQADVGQNPTHMAILPNFSRVLVTSGAGNLCPAGTDVVTSFSPAADSSAATGFGTILTYSYPNAGTSLSSGIASISESGNVVNVTLSAALPNAKAGQSIIISNVVIPGYTGAGYNGCFPIVSVSPTTLTYADTITGLATVSGSGTVTLPMFCPYLPDYVTTASNTSAYVANFGVENNLNCPVGSTDSVALLNPSQISLPNIQYFPGTHPVAMVETPDLVNLYVLNQGGNGVTANVTDLSPTDLSTLATISLPSGSTNPVWAVARVDAKRVFVLTEGDGMLHTINTATNAIISSQSVGGAGANLVVYDPNLNRLYVTNPSNGSIYVLAAGGGPNDTPVPLPAGTTTGGQISIAAPSLCSVAASGCGPVVPVSIAPLPDGSRFYVGSYALVPAGTTCPDPNVTSTTTGCIIPQVTVYDAASLTVKPVSGSNSLLPPSLSLLTASLLTVPQTTPLFAPSQVAVAQAPYCQTPNVPYTPSAPRFRMSLAAAPDSTHVYANICDAGVVADIQTSTSSITTTGTNTPDTLKTDLMVPYSVGSPLANGEPALQNPTFLLTGQ